MDSKYFHFFLEQVNNVIAFGDLFPNFVRDVFARTVQSKALLHAVLAAASALADAYLERPVTRALMHKQQAIASLRQSLGSDITEDTALSIFVLLSMDAFDPVNVSVPQEHLRGFALVLKELNFDNGMASPALMLVWRMAIRLDSGIAIFQRRPPIFPRDADMPTEWAATLARDGRSADLALAAFALDDISHRAVQCLMDGQQENIGLLHEEHESWLRRPFCALALQMELKETRTSGTFLDYPARPVHDSKFAHLLNQWRSIALSFSVSTRALPHRSHADIAHAIEICRTHAAMTLPPTSPDIAPEMFALIGAASVFAGGVLYKREFSWVYDRLAELVAMKPHVLSGLQLFLERTRGIHTLLPEWVTE